MSDLHADIRTLTQAVNELIVEVRALLSRVAVDDQSDAEDDEGDQGTLLPPEEVEQAQRRVKEITDQSRALADYRPAGSYDPRYLEAKRQAAINKTETLLRYHEARTKVVSVVADGRGRWLTNPELRANLTAGQARVLGKVVRDLVEDGVLVRKEERDGSIGRPRHYYRLAVAR